MTINPGEFPPAQRVYYWIDIKAHDRKTWKPGSKTPVKSSPRPERPENLAATIRERLLDGESLTTVQVQEDYGSNGLNRIVRAMEKNGYSIERSERVTRKWPRQVETSYRVTGRPGEKVAEVPEPEPEPEPSGPNLMFDGSATDAIKRRLLGGEALKASQVAQDYGVSKSVISQAVAGLRELGYEVESSFDPSVREEGSYRVVSFPKATKTKEKRAEKTKKGWVDEVPEDAPVGALPPTDAFTDVAPSDGEGEIHYALPPFGTTGLEVTLIAKRADGTVLIEFRNDHDAYVFPVAGGFR